MLNDELVVNGLNGHSDGCLVKVEMFEFHLARFQFHLVKRNHSL
jgi:hypothetical protein